MPAFQLFPGRGVRTVFDIECLALLAAKYILAASSGLLCLRIQFGYAFQLSAAVRFLGIVHRHIANRLSRGLRFHVIDLLKNRVLLNYTPSA